MEIGLILPNSGSLGTPGAMLEIAERAEVLGFETLWTADHLALGEILESDVVVVEEFGELLAGEFLLGLRDNRGVAAFLHESGLGSGLLGALAHFLGFLHDRVNDLLGRFFPAPGFRRMPNRPSLPSPTGCEPAAGRVK